MKLIYEKQVNGENKLFYSNENIPTETDIEILPEQVQKINEVMQELDQQLDPETEGSLANTVDNVVTEIGTDETEGSILGRISALESSGSGSGEWKSCTLAEIGFVPATNAERTAALVNEQSRLIMLNLVYMASPVATTSQINLGSFTGDYEPIVLVPLEYSADIMYLRNHSFETGNTVRCGIEILQDNTVHMTVYDVAPQDVDTMVMATSIMIPY